LSPNCDPFFADPPEPVATPEDWRRFREAWRGMLSPAVVDRVTRRREAVACRAARGLGTPAYASVDEPAAPEPRGLTPAPPGVDLETLKAEIVQAVEATIMPKVAEVAVAVVARMGRQKDARR
jgi:hypothetical protein